MSDFLSLLTAIPSLISNFSGGTTAPYQKQQEELAGRQNQISAALTDTNNPLYQQIYGQYKQQNQNNMGQMIAEAQAQNRMNSNMGRTPLFSNERGSENIFRQMMQQYQQGGVQADQQTRAALTGAGGQTTQGIAGYNSMTPATVAANKGQNMGFQGIYDLLRGYGGQQQPPQQQPSLANPNYANPNANLYAAPPATSGMNYNAFQY